MLELLGAALAFSLTMFMFSTVVSVLVEALINRLFRLRQDGFRASKERLFDEYLGKRPELKVDTILKPAIVDRVNNKSNKGAIRQCIRSTKNRDNAWEALKNNTSLSLSVGSFLYYWLAL